MRGELVAALSCIAIGSAALSGPDDLIFRDNFEASVVEPPPALGINDTGVVACVDATQSGLPCPVAAYPDQDAEFGRDLTDPDPSDGHAGFAFTKLAASGAPLANQDAGYAITPWACTRDEVTGLTWEVKTTDGGRHDQAWRYSWYTSLVTGINNPGVANAGFCHNPTDCDSEKFAAGTNAARLCGYTDWRLPDRQELMSLVHYGAAGAIAIDSAYFPNTTPSLYWTSSVTPSATGPRYVDFATGASRTTHASQILAIRLVRGDK